MAGLITSYGVKGDIFNRLATYSKSKSLLGLALMISSELPAGQSESYAWLGTTPSMQQWIGQRQQNDPNAFNMQITNVKYETGIKLPLDIINNDKTDQANELLTGLAGAYPLWQIQLIAQLINMGATKDCFDGETFFSTTHAFGSSGTFSNAINSEDVVDSGEVTALEAAYAINLAIETMKGFPDDQGRKIKNEDMTEVMLVYQAGTVNSSAIRTAINTTQANDFLAGATGSVTNPLRGQDVKIIPVASGLITTGNTVFSLFRSRADLGKSIVFQENKTDEMVSVLSGADNPYVVMNDAWFIGLKTVGNVGFGLPNDAIQVTFTE